MVHMVDIMKNSFYSPAFCGYIYIGRTIRQVKVSVMELIIVMDYHYLLSRNFVSLV